MRPSLGWRKEKIKLLPIPRTSVAICGLLGMLDGGRYCGRCAGKSAAFFPCMLLNRFWRRGYCVKGGAIVRTSRYRENMVCHYYSVDVKR